MKVAISVTKPEFNSEIEPRFGRSEYFIIVDPESMQVESFKNPNPEAPTGAGINTAQLLCNRGIGVVITGNIGPKAHQVLEAAGVRMITGVSGRCDDAVERFKSGRLSESSGTEAGSGSRLGFGQGAGRGMGMGRGMGCGGGRGRGMGMGMGAGQPGGGRALRGIDPMLGPDRPGEPRSQDDLALLKLHAQTLTEELGRIQRRIEEIEKK